MTEPIRVTLAEDTALVRAALVALLGLEPDIEVVGDTGSAAQVMPMLLHARPDVALLDVDLGDGDGIVLAQTIAAALPETRTLVLTSLATPATVQRALAARVDGFLLKDSDPDELTSAIRRVAAGHRVANTDFLLTAMSVTCPLSARELDVLREAAGGAEAADIAATLHLSTGTVRNYLTAVLHKLGARNRVDAIRIARTNGWI